VTGPLQRNTPVSGKVLILARSFPPFRSTGGSIRVVKFLKYLPALGWLPVVLTIDDRMEYETTRKLGSETLLPDIPSLVHVHRTPSGEQSLASIAKEQAMARQNWVAGILLRLRGAARRWATRTLLLPDKYITWLPFALPCGRQIIRQQAIDVIFTTCPPHSAAPIGALLKLLTRKPLILDFRDDWIDTPWHRSRPPASRLIDRRLEKWVVETADRIILVTEGSRESFLARYPHQAKDKFVLIPNGCDLEDFRLIQPAPARPCSSDFTIVHAGLLNDSSSWTRSPAALFEALRHIQQTQPELAQGLTMAFTGRLPEGNRRLAENLGLSAMVKELGSLPREEYIRLLKGADLLLAINYEGFSTLIPGKIYEYWAAGNPPILLLSYPGAAQRLVERHQLGLVVPPDDAGAIQEAILGIYRKREMGAPIRVSPAGLEAYDRRVLAEMLAKTLSTVM
jgi:glycosyltransferase involved in cell wall biosynthesis